MDVEEDTHSFHERLVDENTTSPQALATQHNDYEYIEKAMVVLDRREMDILTKRYGLGDGNNLSLSQVAKKYGLTRERIRQIQKTALNKLRSNLTLKDATLKTAA